MIHVGLTISTFKNFMHDLLKCGSVIKIGWKQHFSYKSHLFFSFISGAVPLISIYYLWTAIYASTSTQLSNLYSLPQMLTYAFTAFILNSFITPFGLEWEIADNIFQGNLTKYLLFPFSYIKYCFSWLTSEKLFAFFIKLPLVICLYLFISRQIILPNTINFILFLVSSAFAYFIYFFISFIIGISAFWWTDVTGFFYLGNMIIAFCSGLLLPIDILPNKISAILQITPFYYILYFPLQIFIRRINFNEVIFGFYHQLVWIGILYVITVLIFNMGLKKYEAAGG